MGNQTVREYKCFGCDISFETTKMRPSCSKCNRPLKGRKVREKSSSNSNSYQGHYYKQR